MKRTTTLVIVQTVEEDDFPTRVDPKTVVEATAEQLPQSGTRIPTAMLPPPLQRLAKWVAR